MPRGHLDVVLQLRGFLRQLEEIVAIQAKRLDRRAATDSSGTSAALGQRGFAEAVAGLQGGEDDFLAALVGLDDARAPRDENVEGVGGFALPDEKVAEIVVLFL